MGFSTVSVLCSGQDGKESLENDSLIDGNAFNVKKEKNFDLQPVPPFSSGEGLPYAPEGWPNPGDVWSWKVAKRTNKAGYFTDRTLSLPRSLQMSPHKTKEFRSKADIKRYVESNFPDMKIEAFFALFNWQVPSTDQTPIKAIAIQSLPAEDVKDEIGTKKRLKRKTQRFHAEEATDEIGTQRKLKRKTQKKTQSRSGSRPTKKSFKKSFQPNHTHPPLTPGQVGNATGNLKDILDFEEGSGTHTQEKNLKLSVTGNFDDYLDNLEDMLVIVPHPETASDHMIPATFLDNETIELCKKKLSSLLAMDFPSLVSCSDVVEVGTLASQIREDPGLSIDQLVKLKLVEQVPLAGEAFLEAKGNIEEADRFLADLEEKKLKVPNLKNEYNEMKEKVAKRESEINKTAHAIQKIDDQIRQLQSKRNEISNALETLQKSKDELESRLTNVANSIPTLVHEIQLGLCQKPKWELRRANNIRRVAEIQEKFITLRGLTF
ncbi:hypothetical protein Fmac_025634 [Flemingia macrophylla]|uniref:DUF7081 domain-containing protein n=1 Tax=Flemingia macrophylla TaxID=520843 RepID=A0ABD1LSS6_9FABA